MERVASHARDLTLMTQAMDAARARLSAELGAVDPLAEAAAELGLGHMSATELRQLAGAAGADGKLCGGGGMHASAGGLSDMLGGAGAGADAVVQPVQVPNPTLTLTLALASPNQVLTRRPTCSRTSSTQCPRR